MATEDTRAYTENDRLPDPLTAEHSTYPPDPSPVDTVETVRASASRPEAATGAALTAERRTHGQRPTGEDVTHVAARPTVDIGEQGIDAVAFTDVPYPELPAEHFFNVVAHYPVHLNNSGNPHQIQPADVKAIIDHYAESDTDADTGRLRTIKSCCDCQGFGWMAFWRRVQENDEVRAYYERAQRARADRLADELIDDASNSDGDLIEYTDLRGSIQQRSNTAAVKRSELVVKTKAMVMGHLNREKYAPELHIKSQHLHLHGQLNQNPLERPLAMADVDNLSVEDLLTRQKALRSLPLPD